MSTEYKLPYVLREPCEDNGHMYEAEVPILPGCRAWGDTPEEALDYLPDVAGIFLEDYREHGRPLPDAIAAAGEFLVAV